MTQRSAPALEGVRALVTGGTSGLGFAMSQALAEAGARVALTGRTEPRVREAATRIARGVTGLVMDVRDEQSVSAGLDRALAILGGVDVLVNNAGIGMRTVNPDFMTIPAGFWHVSPDGFRDLLSALFSCGYSRLRRGKRTCGLRCSTTSSSLPFVAELCETRQPPAGQANCDTGTTEHGDCGEKARVRHQRARLLPGRAGGRAAHARSRTWQDRQHLGQ